MYSEEEKKLINQIENVTEDVEKDIKDIKYIVKYKYQDRYKTCYFINVVYNDGYCNGCNFFSKDLFKNLRTNKKYDKSILGL